MLIVKKRRYRKKYVIGGSGIFDSILGFAKKIFPSLAKRAAQGAAEQIGKHLTNKVFMPSVPIPPVAPAAVAPATISQKSKENLDRLINEKPIGSGVNAISIRDLVRRLNASGTGLKVA